MEDAHIKTVDEVVNYFSTDSERGLTTDQVKKYQEKYGPNGKSFLYEFLCSGICVLFTTEDLISKDLQRLKISLI